MGHIPLQAYYRSNKVCPLCDGTGKSEQWKPYGWAQGECNRCFGKGWVRVYHYEYDSATAPGVTNSEE